jgi:uncharacterized membrane protein
MMNKQEQRKWKKFSLQLLSKSSVCTLKTQIGKLGKKESNQIHVKRVNQINFLSIYIFLYIYISFLSLLFNEGCNSKS